MGKRELGIYIHIPFCKSKCYYCDFASYTNKDDNIEQYIQKVIQEIAQYNFRDYYVTTIYIGGGTPSYIDEKYIKQLLETLQVKLMENEMKWEEIEITIEINHTYQEFLEAYQLVKKTGFKNINIDLMIGLPTQNIQDIKETLEEIQRLAPNHVSIYSLIVEEKTKLQQLLDTEELKLPEEELERNMYWYVKNTLEKNGYQHYEISNFAKEGYESKHNKNCWEQKEYIGLGATSHSYLNGVRFSNQDFTKEGNWDFTNKKIEERQTIEDQKKEYMLLGLRKIKGVSIQEFKQKYVDNPLFLFRKEIEMLVEENLLEVDGDFIRLTKKGIDFANLVWEEFI